jgi:acetyl-CoA synthase
MPSPAKTTLYQSAKAGAEALRKSALSECAKALKTHNPQTAVSFPGTIYQLPLFYSLYPKPVSSLGELEQALSGITISDDKVSIAIATALCAEALARLSEIKGESAAEYTGFIPDTLIRTLGLPLVDGTIPGIAVIFGQAKKVDAVALVRGYQERGLLTMLVGPVIEQLRQAGVKLGIEVKLLPFGQGSAVAYALDAAVRIGLIFGGLPAGDALAMAGYIKEKVPAFLNLLGEHDAVSSAVALTCLTFGLPVVAEMPRLAKARRIADGDEILVESVAEQMITSALKARKITVVTERPEVPVPFGSAFEGERIRKPDTHFEAGGKAGVSFEWLRMMPAEQLTDGKVTLIGKDIDNTEPIYTTPLAIIVRVGGDGMQEDFETVIERRFHDYLNCPMGMFHMGQRDINWIRISKQAYSSGLRLVHIGKILHNRIHHDFGKIVQAVEVDIITDSAKVEELLPGAREIYHARDLRIASLTDDSVEEFYSCTLCQSFAPNHVCVITPERLGLCGSFSWLDARAAYQILPEGGNKPIAIAGLISETMGEWESVNKFVQQASQKKTSRVCIYSLMEAPMTSCGCFEAILMVVPEANGVLVVNREFEGQTPLGLPFSTLAGNISGGVQQPGVMGIGKRFLLSRKFIPAEGGLERLVWLPKELKELMGEELTKRLEEMGLAGLLTKMATEEEAKTLPELLAFLQKVNHPALGMKGIL